MIPPVILPNVFQQLTDKELLQCSLVCKLWYTLTFDPLLSRHWKTINFQEKIDQLTKKHVRNSVTVTAQLQMEEHMNWEHIFNMIIKRGKMQIQYLKIWSCFNAKDMNLMLKHQGFLNNLIILDLRGSNFDFSILLNPYTTTEYKKVPLIRDKENFEDKKEIKGKDKKIDNSHDKKTEKETENKNNHKEKIDKIITIKTQPKDNSTENKNDTVDDKTTNLSSSEPSSSSSSSPEPFEISESSSLVSLSSSSSSESESLYFLDYFHHLNYVYVYGCKKVTLALLEKFHHQWPTIQLDVKECQECHRITRKGSDKKLKSDPSVLQKLSQCSVCHKTHCDHCRPLWTCEVCGGEPTCRDCRAHGLKCTTCDCDYCYTCQQPKKVLQCRYCQGMSCGQSQLCQNLGYLYRACDRCDYYVCQSCRDDPKEEKLVVCSGQHCTKSYCKTCIHESVNNSIISFDREAVEKRIQEYKFALCSYCNKLYCNECIDEISFYIGSKELPYCILLCKECETYYKTQIIHLFRTPQLNTVTSPSLSSLSSDSDEHQHNHSYADNFITTSQSNILSNSNLSMDSPIDILTYDYDYDQYIR